MRKGIICLAVGFIIQAGLSEYAKSIGPDQWYLAIALLGLGVIAHYYTQIPHPPQRKLFLQFLEIGAFGSMMSIVVSSPEERLLPTILLLIIFDGMFLYIIGKGPETRCCGR